MDFLVPFEFTQPQYLAWRKCACGMIYADNETITQADYDKYYRERYGYGVNDEQQQQRMDSRAYLVNELARDRDARIVDFGGGEGGLKHILEKRYYMRDVHSVGAGDHIPHNIDILIAEHVLEHVYDMREVMLKFRNVKPGGVVIVDVPDAERIAEELPPEMPILDYHQKHINHFSFADMVGMMNRHGFSLQRFFSYEERFMPCRCYIFRRRVIDVFESSRAYVEKNVAEKVKKLKALGDKPVIVWGLGDIALHCLSQHMPNVMYFVDNDPAYEGAVVADTPVLDSVEDDYPIVIIAQSQKKKLIENIRSIGVKNRIIEI